LICGARLGAKLGANGDGAKVLRRQRQFGVVGRVVGQVAWGLGANVDGAKTRVHFLKSFRQGVFEKIFRKRVKK
jgi:hypothetical protein